MSVRYPRLFRLAQAIHGVLSKTETRLLLSGLILLSLLPFDWVQDLWWLFLAIFGVEFAARLVVVRFARSAEDDPRVRWLERGMLLLDLVALFSFLPLHHLHSARYLRLLRFTRLIILFGYWGPMFRNLFLLSTQRERARQLMFLGFCVLALTFISGSVLREMDKSIVQKELGLTGEPTFLELMWWSFRQIEDPGNLVADSQHAIIWILSLILTIAGLFLFSFLIGIGTTVVEELVMMSREQPIGLRNHSLLLNAGERSTFFVSQVVDHYLKQLKRPRWMVMGPTLSTDFLSHPRYRRIHYRKGNPYHPQDLAKIDAAHAKRIIVLANEEMEDPDAETVSAVLSSRQCNPQALIFAEIIDEKNAPAALAAGEMRNMIVVPTEHMLALVTANIMVSPTAFPVIEELLTATGNEIYTYLYHLSEQPDIRSLTGPERFHELFWSAWSSERCLLIGLGTAPASTRVGAENGTTYLLNPTHTADAFPWGDGVRGLVTVGTNFAQARHLAEDLVHGQRLGHSAPPAPLPMTLSPDDGANGACILVCGFRSRTPTLLEHVIEFNPQAEAWVMVRDGQIMRQAREALLESGVSENQFADPDIYPAAPRGRFSENADGSFSFTDAAGNQAGARLRLIQGDWSSRHDLLRDHGCGFDLGQMRTIVIQSQDSGAGDPDAAAVLTVMKLHNLYRSSNYRHRLHADLHVVVEMVDPLKTRLLENSFGDSEDPLPLTIIPVERIRNVLMFYSTVVPGFCPIFREIFDRRDQVFHYCRLADCELPPDARVDLDRLVWTLYRQHGLLLLGVELRADVEGPRVYSLSQAALQPSFDMADIAGFYVIGQDCITCPLPPDSAVATPAP